MNKNKKSLRLAVGLTILLATVCCCCAPYWNGNFVSMLSGLWSAAATVVLGVVAFMQNSRYKELSDKMDIRQNAPEFFVQTPRIDLAGYATASVTLNLITAFGCDRNGIGLSEVISFRFMSLDKPILHLKPISISIDGKKQDLTVDGNNEINVYKPYSHFGIDLKEIKISGEGSHSAVVTIQYENIYGVKYEKKHSFDITVKSGEDVSCSYGSLSIAERVEIYG